MSVELTRLKKEIRIYKIISGSVIDEYVIRTTYRDLNTKSYKWKLEVSYCHFLDTDDELPIVYEVKNYTRDSLQRRFRDWKDSQGLILDLVEVRQYFLPKIISDL